MDRLTLDDLAALADGVEGPVVSIHMPTARAGREVLQGPIRLGNLLDEAERGLTEVGEESAGFLGALRDLVDDADVWQHQADGLAMYADRRGCRAWRVASPLAESVRVAPHPHVRPVLPLASGDERFALLAVSQHDVRLLDCTRDSVDVLELPPGTPTSLDEALAHEDPEKQLQVRAVSPGGPGGQASMFHGHAGERAEHEVVGRYLQAVDSGVSQVLLGSGLPLVLAAVDRVAATYRQVTDHPDVLREAVSGNPDRIRDDELRAGAWPLVARRADERRRAVLAAIDDRRGDGSVLEGVQDVAVAAGMGRADAVVVDSDAESWGRLDLGTGTVEAADGPGPGVVELHDAAVAYALCSGATVLAAASGELPGGAVASTRW